MKISNVLFTTLPEILLLSWLGQVSSRAQTSARIILGILDLNASKGFPGSPCNSTVPDCIPDMEISDCGAPKCPSLICGFQGQCASATVANPAAMFPSLSENVTDAPSNTPSPTPAQPTTPGTPNTGAPTAAVAPTIPVAPTIASSYNDTSNTNSDPIPTDLTTTSPATEANDESSNNSSLAIIVGVVAVVLVLGIIGCVFCTKYYFKKKEDEEKQSSSQTAGPSPSTMANDIGAASDTVPVVESLMERKQALADRSKNLRPPENIPIATAQAMILVDDDDDDYTGMMYDNEGINSLNSRTGGVFKEKRRIATRSMELRPKGGEQLQNSTVKVTPITKALETVAVAVDPLASAEAGTASSSTMPANYFTAKNELFDDNNNAGAEYDGRRKDSDEWEA